MAKKRKSREEKLKADTRHFHYHFEGPSTPKATNSPSIEPLSNVAGAVQTYSYLKHDITKTFMLTGAILAFQILTFFLLKIHTFPFLGIKY